jgi:hypothetical protein
MIYGMLELIVGTGACRQPACLGVFPGGASRFGFSDMKRSQRALASGNTTVENAAGEVADDGDRSETN